VAEDAGEKKPDTVEVMSNAPAARPGCWTPTMGPEGKGVPKEDDSRATVEAEALDVLGRCVPPYKQGTGIGLVTGYVQSGKTLSFTTVAALARDNGYPLVIVIAGTGVTLFGQSSDRLEEDLRLATRSDRKWRLIRFDPKASPEHRIRDTLDDWRDPGTRPEYRQTVVVTVMKHHKHLESLVGVLGRLDLADVPTLVIDDEADQAGLNAGAARNRETTTYRQINQLRARLPQHTYVQYTATPQAPLLINLIDALSPDWAEVLTPGPSYTGGIRFFRGDQRLIRTIPPGDIGTPAQPLLAPPASLRLALATYFVGVAAGWVLDKGRGNRSMMIHPHQQTDLQADYVVWVQTIKAEWQAILGLPVGDPERVALTELLQRAHADLAATVPDLPTLDDLLVEMARAIRVTEVHEINADRNGVTPQVDWKTQYAHILVGGQAMDRGFTVKGLTVTYMPRGAGVGNADTVQQRARFFGYKADYLGYCRVWLENAVRDAFVDYVEHEEMMRRLLREHMATGKPLSDWKRAFLLDSSLRPTRREVLSIAYRRGNHAKEWVWPQRPHDVPQAMAENNKTLQEFLDSLVMAGDVGHADRTESQKHQVAEGVSLDELYRRVLTRLKITDQDDSLKFTAMLLQVKAWLEEHSDATCAVYRIAPGEARRRTRNKVDAIENLFQGANPDRTGSIYPGDRKIHHPTDLTLQVHVVRLDPSPDAQEDEEKLVVVGAYVPAIHIPDAMGKDWLVQ